ncbi:unnamed protein product [Protopolystoma xenopodis]|uniref:Uncharacterized protein n=1 Tax=Protopolystoma xenopodis TaxID=117903 RepID=A0A448WNN7_9PLAT|nr:unnamed protein product [Protopolystoma xenopodis]
MQKATDRESRVNLPTGFGTSGGVGGGLVEASITSPARDTSPTSSSASSRSCSASSVASSSYSSSAFQSSKSSIGSYSSSSSSSSSSLLISSAPPHALSAPPSLPAQFSSSVFVYTPVPSLLARSPSAMHGVSTGCTNQSLLRSTIHNLKEPSSFVGCEFGHEMDEWHQHEVTSYDSSKLRKDRRRRFRGSEEAEFSHTHDIQEVGRLNNSIYVLCLPYFV